MKKLSKSMLTLIVVLSLLFAMAITVFAASWSDGGEFKNRYGSGKYGVTMTLTEDKATASLSISDYFGVVEEGGRAKIVGYLENEEGDVINNKYYYSGETGSIYSAYMDIDVNDLSAVAFHCDFTFYGIPVAGHSVRLS